MSKECTECIFHTQPTAGSGKCDYPIPAWVKIHSGGGWVSGYEAADCSTFKSRKDVFDEVKGNKP
jgi:hypothetical protein